MPTIGRRLVSMLPTRDHSPEAMTLRARAYLAVVTLRHFAVAVILLTLLGGLPSASLAGFDASTPLVTWGWLSVTVGAIAFVGGTWRSERWARTALISSAALTGAMAAALGLSWHSLTVLGWVVLVLLLAITGKDMIVCGDPIRSPFEAVLKRAKRS